jgi:hypothetical protein
MDTRFWRHAFAAHALALLFAASSLGVPPDAFAAQRTFVSSTGVDTNPCSIVAPCRSFATALAHTDADGEIIVLDSAGYGPVTIAQSVSIIAPPGVYAGISVFPTFDGVVVNGVGARVTLKGLSINGQGGNVGIHFQQGARLDVDRCAISGMGGNGITADAASGTVTIADTVARGNGNYGILVIGALQASIVRSRAEVSGNAGFAFADGATVSVVESVAANNTDIGVHVLTNPAGATTKVTLDRLEASGSATGVLANAVASGAKTVVHVTRSNLSHNANSGLQACCPAYLGTLTASVTDSLVANNASGVALYAPTASWTMTVGGNRTVDNGIGFLNFNSVGTFNSRYDNTLSGNLTDTAGTITALFGL